LQAAGAAIKSLGKKFEVFPACCDPFEYDRELWSSTSLALLATKNQGRSTDHHPSLAGMIPIICMSYGIEAREVLSRYVKNAPDYQKIYRDGGLASQANCIITSIGRSEQPWSLGDDYFVKTIGIERTELHSLIDAEIGSVPLPKKKLDSDQRARFDKINAARMGLRLEHIESIAKKGACGTAPGVVVLAMGANKAKCLLELIKRGLVNIAIVDNLLEAKLRELLKEELKNAK
jgi:hypothetical protein